MCQCFVSKQDHLGMNNSTKANNHHRSTYLLRCPGQLVRWPCHWLIKSVQGGRSSAKAKRAFAESLDSDENLSPNIRYFVAMLRFVAIYALFGNLWAQKCLFGSKTVFLGQEVQHFMVGITNYTELNLQVCNYAQKRRICREKSKYALHESFYGHFCPRWKAPNFCHPGPRWDCSKKS